MPVSQTWLSELDRKIQERQVQQNHSFKCTRLAGASDWDNKKKCYIAIGAITVLTLIVVAVCLATIDYDWNNDSDQTTRRHEDKDRVNLSVRVDVGSGQSAPQPVEMSAPEPVHRDMAFDRPGTQYFAGPVKVMTDEERIRYERMMNPVPKSFPEFMDNQKYIVHVMDFHNLLPPTPRRQQEHVPVNQEDEADDDDDDDDDEDDEDSESEKDVFRSLDTSSSLKTNFRRSIPSDFLTQQFLDSISDRKSEPNFGRFSPAGRMGQQQEKHNQSVREKTFAAEKTPYRPSILSQGSKRHGTSFPVRDRNLDDLFVQADRNIEEIARMKQTANFLLTSIGRMLIQKAVKQQPDGKTVLSADRSHKKSPERIDRTYTESDGKLDHLLEVADQDIAKLTQKTNQTDRLMDLISQTLSSSMGKRGKGWTARTLEQKEPPSQQQYNGDNFPFLPFFSPISIQRKENGKPFGTEKPGYLFLGQPVVHQPESSTGSSADVVPDFTLLQTPAFNGKPLDDHPDDAESGDVDAHDDDDEDDESTVGSTEVDDLSADSDSETREVMVREKRISKTRRV